MDSPQDTLPPLVDAARRALARPTDAQLLVDGLGPAGGSPGGTDPAYGVELVDRHGTPLLLCDPQAPLAGAARHGRGATLTLGCGAGHDRVLFRGQLLLVGRDRVEDREVERVELRLTTVVVRLGGSGRDEGVPVPLADYHRHRDPELAAYAESLRAHTDADHAAELREFAARLSGSADRAEDAATDDVVAAASLSSLDPTGTVLRWVDVDGAHEVRLVFSRPALTCQELSEHLRHTLCPHR